MKTGTVRVSEEFIKPDGTKKWYSHERQYDMDTENPLEVFAKAEATVTTFAKSNSQVILDNSIPPGPPPVIQVRSEDRKTGLTPETLLSCSDIKILEAYRLMVKGKPELERAYILRHDQLMADKIIADTKKYGNA